MNTLALIGLGSNVGDRRANLDTGLAALARTAGVELRAVSSYVETAPVGGPMGQSAYLNGAAAIVTTREPLDLLHVLQDVERGAGRVRTVRWAERPLDLDLLLFSDRVIDTGQLTNFLGDREPTELVVPHPRMAFRRFVLSPLVEIAPEVVEPLTGMTVAELFRNLDRRPSYVAIHDPGGQFGEGLFPRLVGDLSAVAISRGSPPMRGNSSWPAQVGEESALMRIERHYRELGLDRWTRGEPRDGWLVSNFWLDAEFEAALIAESGQSAIRQCFLDVRRRILPPTFVVAPPGFRWSYRKSSPRWQGHREFGDVPILEVAPGEPAAVADEVLAMCTAARARS